MMNQVKLTIESNLSERDLVEGCLNMHHSGRDPTIIFIFYAMAKSWETDKLFYYLSLLEEDIQ